MNEESVAANVDPGGPPFPSHAWDRVKGPGRKWDRFLRRHPRLSESSCRIYEVNRVITADDEPRLRSFDTISKELVTRLQPQPDHVWNTDETGAP